MLFMTQRSDFRIDIEEAKQALNLSQNDFRLVSLHEYERILIAIIDKFTTLGKKGLGYYWWWDSLKKPISSIQMEYAPAVLTKLVPPQETVWFIAEDWLSTKLHGKFWLYEGKVAAVTELLGEMYGFEYYVVSKKFEWLLGEDHHGILIGVGYPVVEKIEYLKSNRENARVTKHLMVSS